MGTIYLLRDKNKKYTCAINATFYHKTIILMYRSAEYFHIAYFSINTSSLSLNSFVLLYLCVHGGKCT